MKKKNRIFWIVCASLAGVGLLCLVVGFMMGAGTSEFRNRFTRSLLIGDTSFKDITWTNGNADLNKETRQYEGIRKLELDVGGGELEIIPHDESYVQVEAKYDSRWQEVSIAQSGETLRVISELHMRYVVGKSITGNIAIYIPRDMEFDTVDIELGIGKLYIENIQTREFELSVAIGSAVIDNLSTKELKMDTGTGEIDVRNIQVEEGDVQSGIGSIYMKLQGNQKDYNYNVNVGIGSVKIGSNRYSGLGREKRIDNDASKELDFECGIGEIEVVFAK